MTSSIPQHPLVSVVIPTRNSAATLDACLSSIRAQTYPGVEIIVVDRASTDGTQSLARRHTPHVHDHPGPERSAQRNYGAAKARGHYLLMIDSDMQLTPRVIEACVALAATQPGQAAVIIPEDSFGRGFWASAKALERSYYTGVDWMESPRFIPAATYRAVGGYDEAIAGGEDWDLTQRLRAQGEVGRITEFIRHNEGHIHLRKQLKKRYYYAQGFTKYYAKGQSSKSTDVLRLYGLFLKNPAKILRHPILWPAMILMKTSELAALALGYTAAAKSKRQRQHA